MINLLNFKRIAFFLNTKFFHWRQIRKVCLKTSIQLKMHHRHFYLQLQDINPLNYVQLKQLY